MNEFTEEQVICIQDAVSSWDENKVARRATEELCELQLALLHLMRGKGTVQELLEEMADVRIVLKHLELRYGSYQRYLSKKVLKGKDS